VRKSAAAQLHQLAMMMSPEEGSQWLVKPFLILLVDSSPTVQLSVLTHLPIVVSRLVLDASHYKEIINALIAVEQVSTRQWRLAVSCAAGIQAIVNEVAAKTSF
jgi:hypothetical protein